MNRALPGLAAIAVLCAAGAQAATPAPYPQATSAIKDQPNLSGLWVVNEMVLSTRPSAERRTKTIEGKPPPLQPWAQALYDERVRLTDAGTPYAHPASRCLPNGMPLNLYSAPYPIQVLQTPGQVTMLFEEPGDFRIIYLNDKLPADPDPAYMGYSVGHFEGDTLVVTTIGLTAESSLDLMGLPHTDKLRTTERIRRLKPDQLEIIVTLDDPGAFTAPWSLRRTYRLFPAGQKMLEYVCGQNQRNAPTDSGHTGFQTPG